MAWSQITLPQLQPLQYTTTSFGNALNFNGTNTYGIGQVYVQDSITDFTIDELRIWNTVRTRAEIQKFMYSSIDPNLFTALKLYYRFDQGDANGTNTNERGLYNSAIN